MKLPTVIFMALFIDGHAWSTFRRQPNRALSRSNLVARTSTTNTALVFVKPQAVTEATCKLVRSKLEDAGCSIENEFIISAQEIEEGRLIDAHYGTLAELAMKTDPRSLEIGTELKDRFEDQFGVKWEDAPLKTNGAASDALGGVSGEELETMWRRGPFLKLAPGSYIARLVQDDVPGLPQGSAPFTLNGFYPAMREQFLVPGSTVHAFVVKFDCQKLSWESFREDIVGATDPSKACEGSLRRTILSEWENLGLSVKPSMAANGVHASAGALEGLKERLVWTSKVTPPFCAEVLAGDDFGAALLDSGVSVKTLSLWLERNPMVTSKVDGKGGKIFDVTEGLDTPEVLCLLPSLEEAGL